MTTLRRRVARRAAPQLERLPPMWTGHRWVRRESLRDHVERMRAAGAPVDLEVVHPRAVADNPLPENVPDRASLPDDAGWWGFSLRDVPTRRSGETVIGRLEGCQVVTAWGGQRARDFLPAILSSDRRSIDLREIHWRREHAAAVQRSGKAVELDRATWILERVYQNHAHWLTGHLPKLLLLRERGELADVVLPAHRTPAIDASLRMLGLDADRLETHDPSRPLRVRRLTVLNTDRFRPELLGLVQEAFAPESPDAPPSDRIFISRQRATWRRLVNEEAVWPMLRGHGFQRVALEDLTFPEQVQLMGRAAAVVAPHGAGLANMVFCRPGTSIVEIADLQVPSPNFYAMAAALGHRYWSVGAAGVGGRERLYRDLEVHPSRLEEAVEAVVSG